MVNLRHQISAFTSMDLATIKARIFYQINKHEYALLPIVDDLITFDGHRGLFMRHQYFSRIEDGTFEIIPFQNENLIKLTYLPTSVSDIVFVLGFTVFFGAIGISDGTYIPLIMIVVLFWGQIIAQHFYRNSLAKKILQEIIE